MRLPRFRIRTLMITVAVVALMMTGLHLSERARAYRVNARSKGFLASVYRGEVSFGNPMFSSMTILPDARKAEYFARLQKKYEYAARYPWLPVPPDPPEP